jgi:hypothetical protein
MAAICGKNGRGIILSDKPQSRIGKELRLSLDLKWNALEIDSMVAKGSYRQLATEIGYRTDGGSQFKTIRKSIERLWAVSVIIEKNGNRQGFRILADYKSNESAGKLFIALNPHITKAIIGEHSHVRISMNEVRNLKSNPARLVHQRLCAWINYDKSSRITLDTICSYIWPEKSTNKNTLKKRRYTGRKALVELKSQLNWTVEEYAKGKFKIGRPPA